MSDWENKKALFHGDYLDIFQDALGIIVSWWLFANVTRCTEKKKVTMEMHFFLWVKKEGNLLKQLYQFREETVNDTKGKFQLNKMNYNINSSYFDDSIHTRCHVFIIVSISNIIAIEPWM